MPKKHIKIKRFDKELPLPEYKTKGAVCFDCQARVDVTVEPHSVAMVPLNIALKPPKNHFVLLAARSSLHKRGLLAPNGIGIGDEDFCGENDEYHFPVFNFSGTPVVIPKGDRVAQMMVLPYKKMTLREVSKLSKKSRGGFGTTGK